MGRNLDKYTPDDLKLADEIIDLFQQKVQPNGKISIRNIINFSKDMFEKGTVNKLFKEHFWKNTQGRELIDNRNKLINIIPFDGEQAEITNVIDTVETVEKYFNGGKTQKQRLISSLKRNENRLKKVANQLTKKDLIIAKLEEELLKVKEKNKQIEEKNKKLEELLFTWLDASSISENHLYDLATVNSKRSPIVTELFVQGFNKPKEGFEAFKSFKNQTEPPFQKDTNNIVEFKKQSVLDDFR